MLSINHYAAHALPPGWSACLRALRDAAGALPGADGDAWDAALGWAAPVDLGPAWHAGAAVRMPHLVTTLEHDGPLYLRTGQLPARSSLYLFAERQLLQIAEDGSRTEVPCADDRWRLPCGGGSVRTWDEWECPRRVVVRVDDPTRGLYVQRG